MDTTTFDSLFQQAVLAIDSGDEKKLKQLLDTHTELVTERLHYPGEWLSGVIGNVLKSFFKDPYLLWFISEDAVRNGKLPSNITSIAVIIIDKVKEVKPSGLQEQLDYTLKLVAWSVVARNCGVQLDLLDVLINYGANIEGVTNDALVNGNFDAAKYLIEKGAKLTLPTALCLKKWAHADKMAASANRDRIQFSLVLSALNGKADAVAKAISYGADINSPDKDLYPHGTPLHHAAGSGSLETVKILIEAGANLNPRDTAFNSTPLGWAKYGKHLEIANYLASKGAIE